MGFDSEVAEDSEYSETGLQGIGRCDIIDSQWIWREIYKGRETEGEEWGWRIG